MNNNTDNTDWNTWKPGGGRKGWSPFDKPVPPVRDGEYSYPLKGDGSGKVDWQKVYCEKNKQERET